MRTAGIICELNPLHNGHRYLLDSIRQDGAEAIIACMSGSFTQRGEPAILSKHQRTRAALLNGADLVLELPVSFACGGAERFAFGGASVLNETGVCQELWFGSECGSTEKLEMAAKAVDDPAVIELMKEHLSSGITFAAARERAVGELFGEELSSLLRSPNNILGIEYIRALERLGSSMKAFTIKRKGAAHDSGVSGNGSASASKLREMLLSGKSVSGFVPDNTLDLFLTLSSELLMERLKKTELLLLYRLRTMTKEEMSELPEMSEGLESRLFTASREQNDIEGICFQAKVKRYTMSRLRRSLIHAMLGITKQTLIPKPRYLRVLGFTDIGRNLLREMKERASLPVVVRPDQLGSLPAVASAMAEQESRADSIYSLITGQDIRDCFLNRPIYLPEGRKIWI